MPCKENDMSKRDRDWTGSNPLGGLDYELPAAPALESLLAAASQRSLPLLRPVRSVVMRLALLLPLLILGMLALQVAGTMLPGRIARLTPLTQVNAAWSAAEGYVLEFSILDNDLEDDLSTLSPRPNFDHFRNTALTWAREQDLTAAATKPGDTTADANACLVVTAVNMRRHFGSFVTTGALVTLRIADRTCINELSSELARLPGVSEPRVSERTLYFATGGLTPALAQARVTINGTPYAFPEDFTPKEAQNLYWKLTGKRKGVTYAAFPKYLLRTPDQDGRFKLGDIVRIELDEQGDLALDTVLQHWQPQLAETGTPPELVSHLMKTGWSTALPPGIDEADFDPVQELQRQLEPAPTEIAGVPYSAAETSFMVNSVFWLVPREQVLLHGGAGITGEQQKSASVQAAMLQRTFDGWLAQHPEMNRGMFWGERAIGETVYAGPVPVAFTLFCIVSDTADTELLQDQLSSLPGAPPPQTTIRDLRQRMSPNMKPVQ